MFQTRSRRKLPARGGRDAKGKRSLARSVLCLFLLLWLIGCYLFSQSIREAVENAESSEMGQKLRQHPKAFGKEVLRGLESRVMLHRKTAPDNPWYGWQPRIAETMQCSWRKCFKTSHSCDTCRERDEEMGEAPVPPADWIPDVTMLRRMMLEGKDADGNAWPPKLDQELCDAIGVFGGPNDDNGDALRATHITAQPMASEASQKGPRIMCMIYTMASNHPTNIRAIRETWGGGCDGFLAFSTQSDPRLPAISIPHDGPEDYHNMWQKIRSMWRFVGEHYLEDFDYFFIGGEDLYVLPQNLRAYLATLGDSYEDLHFAGRRFKGYGKNNYFNSGGSGYALSRGMLRKFYNEGLDHPKCNPRLKTSMEDVMVAECLREAFGIGLTDTRDDRKRERFHPFAPASHYNLSPNPTDWYDQYNKEWGILYGEDCCAPDSVSYHYMKKPAMVRHIHALLYHCPK